MHSDIAREVAENLEAVKRHKLHGNELLLAELTSRIRQGENGEQLNYLLDQILASSQDIKGPGDVAAVLREATPGAQLTSDFVAEQIKPWVEQVRSEVFKTSAPPFSRWEDLDGWLVEQSSAQPSPKPSIGVRSLLVRSPEGWLPVRVCEQPPPDWIIPEQRSDPRQYTPLGWLLSEVRIISRATGCSEEAITEYVLKGIKPLLPRYEVALSTTYQAMPSGKGIIRSSFEFQTTVADLRRDEVQAIYDTYRSELGLKRRKALDRDQHAMYSLVMERGGAPTKGVVRFWEGIRQEWNRRHPHEPPYISWKGPQRLFQRTEQALRHRFDVREVKE